VSLLCTIRNFDVDECSRKFQSKHIYILEGYKVADKMKEHGVGASTFSDWWAYKFEVNDAIPLMVQLCTMQEWLLLTTDDAEMSRRLNQEAASSKIW
jgi:hypothetical protein